MLEANWMVLLGYSKCHWIILRGYSKCDLYRLAWLLEMSVFSFVSIVVAPKTPDEVRPGRQGRHRQTVTSDGIEPIETFAYMILQVCVYNVNKNRQ